MLDGAAGFKLEVVVGGEAGWLISGDHDGRQLSEWVVSGSLRGSQALIVFEQGGFSPHQAPIYGGNSLDQFGFFELRHGSIAALKVGTGEAN
jgi:hypothetical protein